MANNAVKTIINCGTTQVSVSIFSESAGTLVLESVVVENLVYDYTSEAEWGTAISGVLRRILSTQKPRGEIVVIAPGQMLLTKNVKVPQVEKSRRRQIISFEAQNSFPFPLDELVWDSQVISSDGVEEEVVLFALKKQNAIRFTNLMRSIGVTPDTIQPATSLDVQAYRYITRNNPETDPVLIVNVGAHTTNLTFVSENGFGINNISIGGNYVTQKLAESTGVPFQAAEQRKLSYFKGMVHFAQGDPAEKAITDAAEAFSRRLSQEITRRVINFKRANKNVGPVRILVSGRGALLPGFTEKLSDLQKMPVEFLEFAPEVRLSPLVSPDVFEENKCELQEAIGEAARLVLPDIDAVNLLPPEIAEEIAFKKKVPFFVLAGILFAVAPWPVWAHLRSNASALSKEIATQKATIAEYGERETQINEAQEKNEKLLSIVDKLSDSLAGRFVWNDFVAELQGCMAKLQGRTATDEYGDKVPAPDRHVWISGVNVDRKFVPGKAASGKEEAVPASVETTVTLQFSMLMPKVDALNPRHDSAEFEKRRDVIVEALKDFSFIEPGTTISTKPDFAKVNVPVLNVTFRVANGKGI
ncbi:MAG: pilus assembly protein PilM [Opitutae bacterium]|nr:pilus assembly protein PilM [Opitutae bacterium]MCD8298700.1 pilus assembly protein PilM [Opitutae bacterium]